MEDDKQNLWIGIENGGLDLLNLNAYNKGTADFVHFKNDPNRETSLSNNSIYSLFQDKQNSIWIGTFAGGLNILNPTTDRFMHFSFKPGSKNSLNNNQANAFLEENSRLWIGTEGGLNRYNKKDGTFKHYVHDQLNIKSIGSNAVWSICKDKRGSLWVGTWGGGLNRFDYKTESFEHYYNDPRDTNSIGSNNIFSIFEDSKGNLWIGTMGGGLNMLDRKRKVFTRYNASNSAIYTDYVSSIIETKKGDLWLANETSFERFDRTTKKFEKYVHSAYDSTSLSSNKVISIFGDSKGNIWIGTDAGLNLFDKSTGGFACYQIENGLPDNSINSIIEDDHGNLWIGTNKGLSKFINAINLPAKPEFRNYTYGDGLQGYEFGRRSCLRGADGTMYFGGTNGFNVFDPDKITENTYIPPIVITDFQVFNRREIIGDKGLRKGVGITEDLVLSHKQSVFSFDYAALNYISSSKNQYAYKMEGFDNDWNYVGIKRTATYTNLDPGRYIFKVKGSNNDGVWNEEGISVPIVITPPFSKTLWFKLILLAGIAGLAAWVYKWREQARDLAEEKRIEEVVAKERNLLRSLIDHAPDNIYIKDTESRFVIANTAQTSFFGAAAPIELMGKTDFDFYPKELAVLYRADEQAIFRSGEPLTNKEESAIDLKGNQIKYLTTKVPLHDENGKVIGLVGISHDITERKRIEEELHQSEERFRALFDQAAVGVAQIETRTGKFLKVNRRFCGIIGYTAEEMLNLTYHEIAHTKDLQADQNNMPVLAEEKMPEYSADIRFIRKNGSLVWVNQTVSTMTINGKAQGYEITVVQDISVRKKMEEQIKADIKEKEVLLKEIHHRVKNNMQVIVSLLRLQAEQIEDPDIIEKFKASEERIASMALVHEMLYGSDDLSRVSFDRYIEKLANTLFDSFGVDTDRVGLELNLEPIHLDVYDAIPCGLLVQELVSNSLKYAFPGDWKGETKIRIGLRRVDGKVELSVADTGRGMPGIADIKELKSLGLKLVYVLGKEQLEGDVQVNRENGMRIMVRFREGRT